MGFLSRLFGANPGASAMLTREQMIENLQQRWDSSDPREREKIAQLFVRMGRDALPVLQHISLDSSLYHGIRQSAVVVGAKFGGEEFAQFMLKKFVVGKDPKALDAAYERGDHEAGVAFGLFGVAIDELEKRGMKFERITKENRLSPSGGVTFVREEKSTSAFGSPQTHQYYKAPSMAVASKWLDAQEINTRLFYVRVDTPEGSIAKDIDGRFDP